MNDLLAKKQHDFVSGRSCMTQLLTNESVEAWIQIFDNHGSLDVYFEGL